MPETPLPPQDTELPLSEHLRELRDRVVIVLGVTLALMAVAYPFSSTLIGIIHDHFMPWANWVSYSPLEKIKVQITVSFLVAVAVGFPLLVYEAFRFAAPGLYRHEKRFILLVFPLSMALFVLGAALAYFVTMPLFFSLLYDNGRNVVESDLSIGQTFSIITNFMLGFGVVFQLPLVVVLAVKMGLVRRKTLVDGRLVAYGLLAGFAVFIAPDPTMLSQLIVGVVLIALFEASLFLARFV